MEIVIHNEPNDLRTSCMGAKSKGPPPDADTGTLSGRLKLAMYLKGDTNPSQIETAIGIPRQTLYAALSGKTEKFTWDILMPLSDHLGVRHKWLQDGELPMYPSPQLSDPEEIQLVDNYRHMSPSHQRDLAEIARRWADEDDPDDNPTRPFLSIPKLPPRQ